MTNEGDSNLLLTQLKKKVIPKGFKLVSGFGDTVLSAGESTTFTVSMKKGKGNYNGSIAISNNDADESPFNFRLTGVVNKTGVVGGRSEVFGDSTDSALAMGVTLAEKLGQSPLATIETNVTARNSMQIRAEDGRDYISSQITASVSNSMSDRPSAVSQNIAEVESCFDESLDNLADLLTEALGTAV